MFAYIFRSLMGAALFAGSVASAITIQLDYSYDTNNFFAQAGAKEAMRAVADYYEELIHDSLAAITPGGVTAGTVDSWTAIFFNPATGLEVSEIDLVVPADTLIVYVGGRDLGGSLGQGGPGGYGFTTASVAFANAVAGRDQVGVRWNTAGPDQTDFGPWGGSITFSSAETWNFGVNTRAGSSTFDFVATALHEMGHLLGIGGADSWMNLIDENDKFTGPLSVASFGGLVPVEGDHKHWQDDGECEAPLGYVASNPLNVLSKVYGSFGSPHASDQIARMDPVSCPFFSSSILVLTDLDLSALGDIGWEVVPPLQLEVTQLAPGQSQFTWPSSTGSVAYLQRTTDLTGAWVDVTSMQSGDGLVKTLTDNIAPAGQAFYRLSDTSASAALVAPAPVAVMAVVPELEEGEVITLSKIPELIHSCSSCSH